ncbi:HAD family hydrolase [soil metagenome]
MTISVALFDLDDTLFAHRKSVRDGFAAHIAQHVPGADPATELDRWDELEETHYSRYLTGELSYLGQRHARVRDFVEPHGLSFTLDADAEEWFETYRVEYRRAWTLYDDTLPCLDALDALGVRIGLISNGIHDFQMAKLDALDLTRRIEHIVLSGEFGAAKPDPSIFLHACVAFGVEPSSAVYIGDRLHTDAIGAARAGLTGVWLDREWAASAAELGEARAAGARVIHSLSQLPALIAR